MWPDLQKGVYSLSNCMYLTVHCVAHEYGNNLKFGHLTLLTWFYCREKFCINRLNTLRVIFNWSWKLRKAIRPLFADPVTNNLQHLDLNACCLPIQWLYMIYSIIVWCFWGYFLPNFNSYQFNLKTLNLKSFSVGNMLLDIHSCFAFL